MNAVNNPAIAALRATCARLIDSGQWPITDSNAGPLIRVRIRGQHGEGFAVFDAAAWDRAAPISRVLAIHDDRRDLTGGEPFDVLYSERQ